MEETDGVTWGGLASAAAVLVVLLVGLLPFGAVGVHERAWLGLVLALGLAVQAALGGRAQVRGLLSMAPMGMALAVGLQHLSRSGLASWAPGRVMSEEATSATLATRGDLVLDAMAGLVLFAGMWTLVTSAREHWGLAAAQRALSWGAVAFALLGITHAGMNAETLLGLWTPRQFDGRFWAPLINPNHHGVVLVMLWPVVLAEARRTSKPWSLPLWLLIAWTWVFPVVASSMGLVLALGVQFLTLLGASLHGRRRWAALSVGALACGVAAWSVGQQQSEWWRLSAEPRLQQWQDTLAMIAAHPLAGTGGGSFGIAYPPFRTVRQFAVYDHAHSEPLQWAVETGGIGVIALLLFLWFAPRGDVRGEAAPWGLGILGLLIHALVDFPLRVPGVALLAITVWGLWAGGAGRRSGRWSLVVMLLLQGVASVWWFRRAQEDHVAARVLAGIALREEQTWLAEQAPWRAEGDVRQINTLKGKELRSFAIESLQRYPQDAALARIAAVRLRDHGFIAAANDAMTRSLAADPQDFRSWWVRSTWKEKDSDTMGAAEDRLQAFRRWPRERMVDPKTFDKAYDLFPISVWWLDELADAPAHWTVRLAWRALADEEYDVALLAAEQAARLRPAAHTWMPARAEALAGMGRKDDAVAWTRDWVGEEPESVWAWVTLANLGASTGRPELVGEGLSRALLVDPDEAKLMRIADKLLRGMPACPAPRCVPGGPAWELSEAVRARGTRECGDAIRDAAAWGGDWSRRIAQRTWDCE